MIALSLVWPLLALWCCVTNTNYVVRCRVASSSPFTIRQEGAGRRTRRGHIGPFLLLAVADAVVFPCDRLVGTVNVTSELLMQAGASTGSDELVLEVRNCILNRSVVFEFATRYLGREQVLLVDGLRASGPFSALLRPSGGTGNVSNVSVVVRRSDINLTSGGPFMTWTNLGTSLAFLNMTLEDSSLLISCLMGSVPSSWAGTAFAVQPLQRMTVIFSVMTILRSVVVVNMSDSFLASVLSVRPMVVPLSISGLLIDVTLSNVSVFSKSEAALGSLVGYGKSTIQSVTIRCDRSRVDVTGTIAATFGLVTLSDPFARVNVLLVFDVNVSLIESNVSSQATSIGAPAVAGGLLLVGTTGGGSGDVTHVNLSATWSNVTCRGSHGVASIGAAVNAAYNPVNWTMRHVSILITGSDVLCDAPGSAVACGGVAIVADVAGVVSVDGVSHTAVDSRLVTIGYISASALGLSVRSGTVGVLSVTVMNYAVQLVRSDVRHSKGELAMTVAGIAVTAGSLLWLASNISFAMESSFVNLTSTLGVVSSTLGVVLQGSTISANASFVNVFSSRSILVCSLHGLGANMGLLLAPQHSSLHFDVILVNVSLWTTNQSTLLTTCTSMSETGVAALGVLLHVSGTGATPPVSFTSTATLTTTHLQILCDHADIVADIPLGSGSLAIGGVALLSNLQHTSGRSSVKLTSAFLVARACRMRAPPSRIQVLAILGVAHHSRISSVSELARVAMIADSGSVLDANVGNPGGSLLGSVGVLGLAVSLQSSDLSLPPSILHADNVSISCQSNSTITLRSRSLLTVAVAAIAAATQSPSNSPALQISFRATRVHVTVSRSTIMLPRCDPPAFCNVASFVPFATDGVIGNVNHTSSDLGAFDDSQLTLCDANISTAGTQQRVFVGSVAAGSTSATTRLVMLSTRFVGSAGRLSDGADCATAMLPASDGTLPSMNVTISAVSFINCTTVGWANLPGVYGTYTNVSVNGTSMNNGLIFPGLHPEEANPSLSTLSSLNDSSFGCAQLQIEFAALPAADVLKHPTSLAVDPPTETTNISTAPTTTTTSTTSISTAQQVPSSSSSLTSSSTSERETTLTPASTPLDPSAPPTTPMTTFAPSAVLEDTLTAVTNESLSSRNDLSTSVVILTPLNSVSPPLPLVVPDQRVSTAAASVGIASAVAAALGSTIGLSASSKATQISRSRALANCPLPGQGPIVVEDVAFPLARDGQWRLSATAALSSAAAVIGVAAGASIAASRKVKGLAAVYTATLLFYGPNACGLAAQVLSHPPVHAADAVAAMASLFVVVAATAAAALGTIFGWPPPPSKGDGRVAAAATAVGGHPRWPAAVRGFVAGTRDADSSAPRRLHGTLDVVTAILSAVLCSVQYGSDRGCAAAALSMVAAYGAQLAYLCRVRPHEVTRDWVIAIANVVAMMGLGITIAMSILYAGEDRKRYLAVADYFTMSVMVLFYGELLIEMVMATRAFFYRRKRVRRRSSDGSLAVGGESHAGGGRELSLPSVRLLDLQSVTSSPTREITVQHSDAARNPLVHSTP